MSSVVEQLSKYGYLPPKGHGTLNTNDVEEAIQRYRDFLQLPDISIGELFSLERCGCSDIQADQSGSGSWPSGCHPEYPDNHSFAVYFDLAGFPSHWKAAFNQAWELVQQAYADIGMIFFETKDRRKADTIVTWEAGRNWIGLAIVPRGPKCGQKGVWTKYDIRYGSSFALERLINQLAFLLGHEKGHNMGLSHTSGGIMNPVLINGTFHSNQWRRNDPAFPTLKRWFGGEPIVPTAPIWTIPSPEQPRD